MSRKNTVGAMMTLVGGFAMLSAAGGILAFQFVFSRHPELVETGPVIQFLSKHILIVASFQFGLGAVLAVIGLALIWTGRRTTRE